MTAVHPAGAVLATTVRGEQGTDDSGGVGKLPRRALGELAGRALVLGLAVTIGYGGPLADLARSLGTNTPLAFAAIVPFCAVVVALAAVRRAPLGSPRLANRSAERIVGGTLVALAVAVSALLPDVFGFDTQTWRAGLVSLPLFCAGAVIWLFGLRAGFWVRHGLVLLVGAAPVYYVWAIGRLLRATTAATNAAAIGVAHLAGTNTASVGGERLVDVGGQLVIVGSACSGAASMIGWLVVGLALCPLLAGRSRHKLGWLAAGAALAFGANVARLIALALVGRAWGAGAALDVLHPYAGLATMALACGAALALARPFGLVPRVALVASLPARLHAVAPRSWRAEAAVLVVAALGLGVLAQRGWQFERLGGRNGALNGSAAWAVEDLGAGRAAGPGGDPTADQGADRADLVASLGTVVDLGAVDWASQYFGAGATWRRFTLVQPAGQRPPSAHAAGPEVAGAVDQPGPLAAIGVDVTAVVDEANLDTYPLEACYGFHGWQVDRVAVQVLDERTAERISYRDGETGTVVVSWRQRVSGGYERVVVSTQFRASAEGDLTLPDAAAASDLVDRAAAAVAAGAWQGRPR